MLMGFRVCAWQEGGVEGLVSKDGISKMVMHPSLFPGEHMHTERYK